MLDAKTHGKLTGAFATAVQMLGTPANWSEALPPNRSKIMTVGFRAVGRDDISVVNAFGYETKVITIRAADIPTPPVQFDTLLIHGERYIVQSSHQIYVGDTLVGHKCYCKGM